MDLNGGKMTVPPAGGAIKQAGLLYNPMTLLNYGKRLTMNRIAVMIIDEHPAVRHSLKALLNTIPEIEVIASIATLDEGETLAQNAHPAVVLLGLRTYTNNTTALDGIVTRFTQKGMAVIVLSPYLDDVEQEMFYQAGAKNYLLKDINIPQLIAAIQGAISSSEALIGYEDLDHTSQM